MSSSGDNSNGEDIVYRVRFDTTQAAKDLAAWGKKVQKVQEDIWKSGRIGGGGSPVGPGRGGGPGATGPGRGTGGKSSYEQAERDQARRMAAGREKAARDRERKDDADRKAMANDAKKAQSQRERVELIRVKEAAAEDKKLAAEMAAGRRKAERERLAAQKKADRDAQRESQKAQRQLQRDEVRRATIAEQQRQTGLDEWREARSARRGGGSGHGRGGITADLARAAIPDHYVRSVFRIEDAANAMTSGGMGRRGVVNARLAGRAINNFGSRMTGGLLASGAGGLGAFGLGTGGMIAGGGALAAGGILGAHGLLQGATTGHPQGGFWDARGKNLLDAREGFQEGFTNPTMRMLGLTDHMHGQVKTDRLARENRNTAAQQKHFKFQQDQQYGVESGIRGNYNRSQPTYGDIGASFLNARVGMVSGTAESVNFRLAQAAGRNNYGSELAENRRRQGVSQETLSKAGVDTGLRIKAREEMQGLMQEELQITEALARSTAERLRITKEEGNLAKERLRNASTSFGFQDKGEQRRLLRINEKVQNQGIGSLRQSELRDYNGIGTEETNRLASAEARRRSEAMGFTEKVGGGDVAAINAADEAGQKVQIAARVALDRAGTKNMAGDMSELFTGLLKKNNEAVMEGLKVLIPAREEVLKRELFQEFQRLFNEMKTGEKQGDKQARFARGIGANVV